MRQLKTLVSFLVLAVASAFMFGSFTQKVALEERKIPRFEYTPQKAPGLGSADLTIALIAPNYAETLESTAEPFRSFQKGLEDEMMELLTQRGYAVRGPFESMDEMLYTDKEAAQLAFKISIEPEFEWISGGWKEVEMANKSTGYRVEEGAGRLYGKINVLAIEPISGEKMWAKSVSIPEQNTRPINSHLIYTGSANRSSFEVFAVLSKAGDYNVSNVLGEVFEASFPEIMTQLWRYLDPAEFEILRPKITALKKG